MRLFNRLCYVALGFLLFGVGLCLWVHDAGDAMGIAIVLGAGIATAIYETERT